LDWFKEKCGRKKGYCKTKIWTLNSWWLVHASRLTRIFLNSRPHEILLRGENPPI
jgi:hypothetical protein